MVAKDVTMPCPQCQSQAVPPLEGSTLVIAWYRCPECGHFWSARVRNGKPVAEESEAIAT